ELARPARVAQLAGRTGHQVERVHPPRQVVEVLAVTLPLEPLVEVLLGPALAQQLADAQAAGGGVPRALLLVEAADPAAPRVVVAQVWAKDASARLGRPAFKILGASWAVCSLLAARVGEPVLATDLPRLRAALGGAPALVAATDGNHGREVARMAALLGVPAT